jgi:hypothetical protein
MRTLVLALLTGSFIACCGGFPDLGTREATPPPEPEPAPAEPAPVPTAPPIVPTGPTVVFALESVGPDCALKIRIVDKGTEHVITRLTGACPSAPHLVLQPNGERLLIWDDGGILDVDLATQSAAALPSLSRVLAVRYGATGGVVAITQEAAPQPDGTPPAVTVDGQKLAVDPAHAGEDVVVARTMVLQGSAWQLQKTALAYGRDGESTVEADLAALAGVALAESSAGAWAVPPDIRVARPTRGAGRPEAGAGRPEAGGTPGGDDGPPERRRKHPRDGKGPKEGRRPRGE